MSHDIAQQMQQLYQQYGELPGIAIELHKELLAIQVDNNAASATVFLQGAQLSRYALKQQVKGRPGEQQEKQQAIIWCSEQCDYSAGKSLRGGIPICWPWFGDLDKNPAAVRDSIQATQAADTNYPAHGLVRTKLWDVAAIEILDSDNTRIKLVLNIAEGQEPLWPTATSLRLDLTIGPELGVQLDIDNHSNRSVNFSQALHSYFAVSDIAAVSVSGLDDLDYTDCLDGWTTKNQSGTLCIDAEVDRIYHGTSAAVHINDTNWQRIINLHNSNSHSAIVWNPWIEKAKRLSNFADNDYQHMLCIETANVGQDSVCLAAGQSHRLAIRIVSNLHN